MIYLSVEELVIFLNELVELDARAMANLIDSRVECNEALADHPCKV